LLSALLVGCCLTAASAHAATAAPDAQGHMYANDAASDGFGVVHDQVCVADFGCWNSTASTSTSLVATATASASDQAAALASGLVDYAFIVNGPTIRGFVSATASGARAEAHAGIVYGGLSFYACSAVGFGLGCGDMPASAFLSDSFSSTTGVINWIEIVANGTVYKDGAFSSFADPVIAIDPLFLAANPGFSLTFSPNLGGGPLGGVPEPATWALMLAGFGLAGQALRGRRRIATA
jgi:hypothetical protein